MENKSFTDTNLENAKNEMTIDKLIEKIVYEKIIGFTASIDEIISRRIKEHFVSLLYYFIKDSGIDVNKSLQETVEEFLSLKENNNA